jgi:hypothetical protein
MGNKLIFKEPLKGIKYAVDQYQNQNSNMNRNNMYNIYKPGFNPQNNTSNQNNAPNKYNMNNNNTRKLKLQNMDVIPKFIYYGNDQEMNKELAYKLFEKKNKLNTLVNTYISKEHIDFTKSIMDIELEMDKYKSIMEQQKDKDYEGFKELLFFINNNRTNENLKDMQSISLNEYKNMNYDIKKKVLSGIFENRDDLSKRLNIYVNANAPNNSNNNTHKRLNTFNYNNNGNNMNNNRNNNNYDINSFEVINHKNNNMMESQITQEQIDLFKIFVNNPQIQNNHVITYFNKFNPKVREAAENYFKNIYRLDYITLNYKYKNKEGKVHKFRFSGDVDALFVAAQSDYLSISNPRLFLENGKEILKNKKTKCIGALNLENNANIHVW